MKMLLSSIGLLSFLLLTGFSALAGEKTAIPYEAPVPPPRSVFDKGRITYSSLYQGYGSFSFDHNGPTINYFMSSSRLSCMLTSPRGEGFWRGNWELMLEGIYGTVFDGPGDWIAGGTVLIRRNFIARDEKWNWYLHAGGGVIWNDIYKDQSQTLIGRSREFSLVAGGGLRYQINAKWSFNAELDYRHISNADTAPRNTGLNSLGGGIGFGYTF
ncbi:MAG TPA: acyloxyacyl hydrolase [Verrucomicrobiales bacterium]|nr:acyloxyacyl hydrolase [Verrucomicrobiales bacterium]